MLRYMALAWNRRDTAARETATRFCSTQLQKERWSYGLRAEGLIVLTRAGMTRGRNQAISLSCGKGLIAGDLYHQDLPNHSSRVDALTEQQSAQIVRSRGRCLIQSYWGNYLLFLTEPTGGEVHVLRSPMGRYPCYYSTAQSVHLIFSDIEDCLSLEPLRFSINWDRVRAQACGSDIYNGETSLEEVNALDCGACLTIGTNAAGLRGHPVTITPYWHPGAALEPAVTDFAEASAALRGTVFGTTAALVAAHESVVVPLSGGLDSSTVVAALTTARPAPQVTCINYHSSGCGDERMFARSMARKANVALVEHERDPAIDFRMFLKCARTPSPLLHFGACYAEPANEALARRVGATAIFDGALGDQVFGSGVREEVLLEYVQSHGIRGELLTIAKHYCILRRVCIWPVLYRVIRAGLFARPPDSWSSESYFRAVLGRTGQKMLVSDDVLTNCSAARDRFIHPWLRDPRDLAPGKQQLLFGLQAVTCGSCESPFRTPESPPTLSPLCTQPVVELAMRIPSFLNIQHAQDRAVARHAFAGDLPDAIVARGRGKGGPDAWLQDAVLHNRKFLRELFLDGHLVKEHVLDRNKIERALADGFRGSQVPASEIIVQLYIEAWAKQWAGAQAIG